MSVTLKVEAAVSVLVLLILFYILNAFGVLSFFNQSINSIVPDTPDNSCKNDSDCTLAVPSKLSECASCDPYGCKIYYASGKDVVAINSKWEPRCIFRKSVSICGLCIGGVDAKKYAAKCQNGTCVKVGGTAK